MKPVPYALVLRRRTWKFRGWGCCPPPPNLPFSILIFSSFYYRNRKAKCASHNNNFKQEIWTATMLGVAAGWRLGGQAGHGKWVRWAQIKIKLLQWFPSSCQSCNCIVWLVRNKKVMENQTEWRKEKKFRKIFRWIFHCSVNGTKRRICHLQLR